MRFPVRILAVAIATLVWSGTSSGAAEFWHSVQSRCNATAKKPSGETGQRIAQAAVDEFGRFGGHRIDASGKLTSFGLTGAEHEKGDGSGDPPKVGHLPWWRVMTYWRALYGDEAGDKLEVRGYQDASKDTHDDDNAALLRTTVARLLKAAETESDPETQEILRELAWRSSALDTPWSAAFISYVLKQAGVQPNGFAFSNAHRSYIYDAFAVDDAEFADNKVEHLYRACPVLATRMRAGDLICDHREAELAGISELAVRDRIRGELADPSKARSVRKTHCEVVAYVDARARRAYTIGGNVLQGVSVRALPLRRSLKLAVHRIKCGARTVPKTPADLARQNDRCSLNDKKWLALLQLR